MDFASPQGTGRTSSPPSNRDDDRSFYGSEVDSMNAVEQAKKVFLQAYGEYVQSIKRGTEFSERQNQVSRYEQRLADNCKRALGTASSDVLAQPSGKIDYKHLPSLIENARSYTTSSKYAEWQAGISGALPHLEEAYSKLRMLEIPNAEKDIVEPVRVAVNTPFMQMIKCKDKQRESKASLLANNVDTTYAAHMQSLYTEFQANHRERKVRQALELVKRMEAAVQTADGNFMSRVEAFGEAKRLMAAAIDPQDPLNMQDYEPPHEQAIASLHARLAKVQEDKAVWMGDLENLVSKNADTTVSLLRRKAAQSSDAHKAAREELDAANDDVRRCWEALMEAQSRAAQAEKGFISTKIQEDIDKKMVDDVVARVEEQKARFNRSIANCDQYGEVLRLVERYINARWEPWRDIVKNETKGLVVEVCEVYSISEKVLGDLIDRKQAQVDHASREEKDCMEKFHKKWDQLDPNADQEKARAHEAQAVKETAHREVERLTTMRQGMRDVLQLCRPVMEYFGISIDAIERRALLEEWDKQRVRLYKEFEDMIEPYVVRVNVMGQTPDDRQQQQVKALAEEDYKRLNTFLLSVPDRVSVPAECKDEAGVQDKQRLTVGDMVMRVAYMMQELDRHQVSGKTLESGFRCVQDFLEAVKGGPALAPEMQDNLRTPRSIGAATPRRTPPRKT